MVAERGFKSHTGGHLKGDSMKALFGIIGTLVCLVIGLIPEGVMWMLWGLIHPSSETSKILVLAVFWLGGAGLCFLFAFLAFSLWVVMLGEIFK